MFFTAVDELVANIIGIDTVNDIVYGIGNNKKSYMKYSSKDFTWYAISSQAWKKAKTSLSIKREHVIVIEDTHTNKGDPATDKTFLVDNNEKWGGEYFKTIGVFLKWQLICAWLRQSLQKQPQGSYAGNILCFCERTVM